MRRVFPIAGFRARARGLVYALFWLLCVRPGILRAADAAVNDSPEPLVVPKVSTAPPAAIAVPQAESPEDLTVPAPTPVSPPPAATPAPPPLTVPPPSSATTPISPPPPDENNSPNSVVISTQGKPRPTPHSVMENKYFIVSGPDYVSVSKAMEIIGDDPDVAAKTIQGQRGLQALMAKFFTWPAGDVTPIEVQLTPSALVDFNGPFKVAHDASGHRMVILRWDAETKFSDTCEALATAALEQLVAWQHDPATAEKIPDWLRLAFGQMLEVQIKPPLLDALVEAGSHQERALSLRQIVEAKAPFSDAAAPILAMNSYWLARYLEEKVGDGAPTRQLFDALSSGADPVAALQAAFAGQFSDGRDLETWWRVGYFAMLEQHAPIIQDFAQTSAMLDRFQSVLVRRDGQERRVPLDEAWPDRADPDVNKAVTAMEIEAHAKWPEANPVYNNALVSVMGVLDALRRGNDEAALHTAWKQYETDRADGKALEDAALAALDETNPPPETSTPVTEATKPTPAEAKPAETKEKTD